MEARALVRITFNIDKENERNTVPTERVPQTREWFIVGDIFALKVNIKKVDVTLTTMSSYVSESELHFTMRYYTIFYRHVESLRRTS
jgi:hypothetical protein